MVSYICCQFYKYYTGVSYSHKKSCTAVTAINLLCKGFKTTEQRPLKYVNSCWNTKVSFYLETSVANVIKLVTAVSYDFSQKTRVFVPSKPFQPCLMFELKARAYPSEAPFEICKQVFEYQRFLLLRDIWLSKLLSKFKCCPFFQHQC